MNLATETVEDNGDDLRTMLENGLNEDIQPETERQRDEKGRFTKGESKEIETEVKEEIEIKEPEEEKQVEEIETTEVSPTEKEEERINPPTHWSGSSKVRWEKLPRSVQEAISKDYEDLTQSKTRYGAIDDVIKPYSQSLRMRYGDETNGIKTMLAYADALEKDPLGTLQYIARERGINLFGHVAQQQGRVEQGNEPQANPYIQQIHNLQTELAQLKQGLDLRGTEQLQSQIDAFAQDPKHPYFNDVKVSMGALIQAAYQQGRELSLEDAYDMAINADPVIRAEIIKERQEFESAEKARKIAEANARKTPKGAPGYGTTVDNAPKSNDVRGILYESFAEYE